MFVFLVALVLLVVVVFTVLPVLFILPTLMLVAPVLVQLVVLILVVLVTESLRTQVEKICFRMLKLYRSSDIARLMKHRPIFN